MALWGGRFSEAPADAVFALSRSVHYDWRLAPYDIRSSLAHLSILESSGLVAKEDAKSIRAALVELSSTNTGTAPNCRMGLTVVGKPPPNTKQNLKEPKGARSAGAQC